MTFLFFGIFDPDYSRNRVLRKSIESTGAHVIECRVDFGERFKYIRLIWKFILHGRKSDVVVVCFPGQKVMFLARFLTRKPIIFDVFTSHYGGYILDRGKYSKTSMQSKYYRFLDKYSCRLADMVLLDTNAHINFFVGEYGLDYDKFERVWVGTDSSVFFPNPIHENSKFTVHFHGSFIPLHGVEHIINAAKILENKGVVFNIIGGGQTYENCRRLAAKLGISNINFVAKVSYDKLAGYINSADVCLGIFGDNTKASLVIPNKIFEALACAKPVITAESEACRELLTDGDNVIFTKSADPIDLAEKILLLKSDDGLRESIARSGYALFQGMLLEKIIGQNLLNKIYERGLLPK